MFAKFTALLLMAFAMAFSTPALAQAAPKIAVVDFQSAIQQTKEGQAAQKKLDATFQQKKTGLDQFEAQLRQMKTDYDKQASILSDTARKAKEQELMQAQQQYQQAYMQSEQDMQAMYGQLMQSLLDKMKMICTQIGKEKGYTLIIEKGAVVFSMDSIDITSELVKRYDASTGG